MQKILCLGQVYGRCEVGTYPELESLLSEGWVVKNMQTVGNNDNCCCYVLIEKEEK